MAQGVRSLPLITHVLLLPTGALLVWWWGQPVEQSRWDTELLSLFWPYTIALTTVPGVVAGVVEARLLRRRHPAVGIGFVLAAGVVGLVATSYRARGQSA